VRLLMQVFMGVRVIHGVLISSWALLSHRLMTA
jgi:Co/Zn/Cd efflux system component